MSLRQGHRVTQNVSITRPAAQRPLRCARPAARTQRASDVAMVPPARVKGVGSHPPANLHPHQPTTNLDLAYSPPHPTPSHPHTLPFTQGHLPKGQPPPKTVWTKREGALGAFSRPRTRLGRGPQAQHPRGLHGCRGARTTGEPEFLTQDSSPGLLPRPPPQAGLWASGPARRTALHCGPSPAPRPGWCRPRTSTLSPQASNSSLFLGYVNVSEESLPPL